MSRAIRVIKEARLLLARQTCTVTTSVFVQVATKHKKNTGTVTENEDNDNRFKDRTRKPYISFNNKTT